MQTIEQKIREQLGILNTTPAQKDLVAASLTALFKSELEAAEKWVREVVSVDDRLPEDSDDSFYLCFDKWDNFYKARYIKGSWYGSRGAKLIGITHFLLPTPTQTK